MPLVKVSGDRKVLQFDFPGEGDEAPRAIFLTRKNYSEVSDSELKWLRRVHPTANLDVFAEPVKMSKRTQRRLGLVQKRVATSPHVNGADEEGSPNPN